MNEVRSTESHFNSVSHFFFLEVVLEMSRGASVILIILYILSLVFQLYSHSHLYNPDAIIEYRTPSTSTSSSRASSPSRTGRANESQDPKQHSGKRSNKAEAQGTLLPPPGPLTRPSGPSPLTEVNRRLVGSPRRANSLPFGSAAALGRGSTAPIPGPSPRVNAHVLEKAGEITRRGRQNGLQDSEMAVVEQESIAELESPEMNLPVAVSVLVLVTGLTCECMFICNETG
jgi:Ca2+:H+ antiporter